MDQLRYELSEISWISFMIVVLATWELTALLRYARGPFQLFQRFRQMLANGGAAKLAKCFYCLALWTSVCLVLVIYRPLRLAPVLVFAVAGAVSLIELSVGFARHMSSNQSAEADRHEATAETAETYARHDTVSPQPRSGVTMRNRVTAVLSALRFRYYSTNRFNRPARRGGADVQTTPYGEG